GQRAGCRRTAARPHADEMSGDTAGRATGPDQLERRKQPPALVAPQDAARDQKARHRRGVEALAAKTTRHPKPFSQLADLRHAVHGDADRAAKDVFDSHLAEFWKDGVDPALNGACETLRPRIPGGL